MGEDPQAIRSQIVATREKMGQTADAIAYRTNVKARITRGVRVAEENPLGLAIGSVAVGFLAGIFIPATRVEIERLGPIADEVKHQVVETGQEALVQAREVAQDAVAGAADAAQTSGQEHLETLTRSVQESVEEVKDTASQN
jgi:Protein of unknown function (DUF3618)